MERNIMTDRVICGVKEKLFYSFIYKVSVLNES